MVSLDVQKHNYKRQGSLNSDVCLEVLLHQKTVCLDSDVFRHQVPTHFATIRMFGTIITLYCTAISILVKY